MVAPKVSQVRFQFGRHAPGVDPGDQPSVLHLDQPPEVVDARLPGDAVRDQEELRVVSLLVNDSAYVAEDVGLLAPGGSVSLCLDQNPRIALGRYGGTVSSQ